MKKTIWISTTLILLTSICAYYYFSKSAYEIRITEDQIREKLASQLPLTKRYFFIIELTLANPRVSLTNGSSRVTAGLDAELTIKITNPPTPLKGTIDISSGISYRSETGEFFLTDPKIENLQMQAIPDKFQAQIEQAVSIALTEYFDKNPVYTIRKSDAKQAAIRLVLKNVVVENNELVVTLGI
ncbi:MAG: DUF1439 domain-containing protein [Gammaproteobacteria bacterium]